MGSRTLQRPVVALLGGIPLIIVWALGSLSWFWFHPVMMAISMFPLAGNAILLKKIGGYQNTKYHRYLMMLCTASMCFAWYVIHTNKEMAGKQHRTTWHGWLGALGPRLGVGDAIEHIPPTS
eukprot:GEMP01079444.1.p1 GENE.GEMP01079444.1~~GEMP01079444.1.p1  ORF type:complete len:122 (+),score=14.53 GEMP01079444.1:34-399(+)